MVNKDPMEIFKEIPGFDGKYEVSNYGNVKNVKRNRMLSPSMGIGGYLRVDLTTGKDTHKNFRVHTLVAMAFLEHTQQGLAMTVDHIDFDKINNHVDNLQLISLRDNSIRTALNNKSKTSKYLGVHYCLQKKKFVARIIKDGKKHYLGSFKKEQDAAKAYQKMELELYGKITQQI